jgi:uncharacterized membrane protein
MIGVERAFDPRNVLLARHAQHVVLVHFPIALFITGVAFDFAAQWKKSQALAEAAYYNLLFAAFSAVPVLVTGILAWQFQLEGQKLKGLLLLHLILGCLSALLIGVIWWLHFLARRRKSPATGLRTSLECLAVLLIGITGHIGGFLSGVNVPGQ